MIANNDPDDLEQEPGWRTHVWVICGGAVGAGLGFWWQDYSGAVSGATLGILFGYALGKPN
jgi:hypothetical protein